MIQVCNNFFWLSEHYFPVIFKSVNIYSKAVVEKKTRDKVNPKYYQQN